MIPYSRWRGRQVASRLRRLQAILSPSGGCNSVQIPLILRGIIFEWLCLSCNREEVGGLETGQGVCCWSWRASFLEEKSGWVGGAVSIKSRAGGENAGC